MHDLPLAEQHYLDAFKAAEAFPPHDARLRSSFGNLLNLAAGYQAERRFEDADRVIGIVIEARDGAASRARSSMAGAARSA